MASKPPNSTPIELKPPLNPTDEEFDAFLQQCVKAGVSKTRWFAFMDEMFPESITTEEGQADA